MRAIIIAGGFEFVTYSEVEVELQTAIVGTCETKDAVMD